MLEVILANQIADQPPHYCHLLVKNGHFTLLLLELILADQVVDLLAELPPWWRHLMAKNGNFRFQLLKLI